MHKRFADHKKNANNEKHKEYNRLLYRKMRETDFNDWYIELYEDFQAERKEQLNKREGEVIRETSTLNKKIEDRTIKEWREANSERERERESKRASERASERARERGKREEREREGGQARHRRGERLLKSPAPDSLQERLQTTPALS